MKVTDLIILAIIFLGILSYNINRYFRKQKLLIKKVQSKKSHQDVAAFLEEQGYVVTDLDSTLVIKACAHGKQYDHRLVADLVVQKHGKPYIVVILGPKQRIRLSSTRFRQQLLMLSLAFNYSVLVVDLEGKKVREVTFNLQNRRRMVTYLGYGIAFLVGFFLFWAGAWVSNFIS